MAKKTATRKTAGARKQAAPSRPERMEQVTVDQAKRIFRAQGIDRVVLVRRDRVDPNRIKEILIRE